MQNYKKLLKELRESKSSAFIYNSSRDHANLIISELIDLAKDSILLYTSGSDITFYKKIKDSSILQQKKNLSVKILFDDTAHKDEFINMFPQAKDYCYCRNNNLSDFSLVFEEKEIKELELDPEYARIRHFMTVDKIAFRMEVPHVPGAENVEAIAGLNRPKICESLIATFDMLINTGYFTKCQQ